MSGHRPLELCLFGAPLDTGNRGVEALGRSVLSGIAHAAPGSRVTVFDNGWGLRGLAPSPDRIRVELCGVRRSRRLHRPESWWNVRTSQHLGGLRNPVALRVKAADAVLDISGGDSFSDLYGTGRLRSVLEPKWAALRAHRSLVLLPQTYGPFTETESRRRAQTVVRGAALAYSRDADSHAVLLELLGEDADRTRHRAGVDVAFALHPRAAADRLGPALRHRLDSGSGRGPIAGVNVSGLLWAAPGPGGRFGLALDYQATVSALVGRLLASGADVVLVPHVTDVAFDREGDRAAAEAVRESLPVRDRERVYVASDLLDAGEAKWLISRCDWFCGTRMHSTIAGLSSQVPTAALAYSMKTQGVFATCGVASEVTDARSVGTGEAVERLYDAFVRRSAVSRALEVRMPSVIAQAAAQIADICAWVQQRAAAPPSAVDAR